MKKYKSAAAMNFCPSFKHVSKPGTEFSTIFKSYFYTILYYMRKTGSPYHLTPCPLLLSYLLSSVARTNVHRLCFRLSFACYPSLTRSNLFACVRLRLCPVSSVQRKKVIYFIVHLVAACRMVTAVKSLASYLLGFAIP